MQYKSQVVDFILYKNGTDGEDGNTPYVHIKYSNDGGTTFTDNNGENVGEWLGIYVDYNESDPIDPSKYKWTKVKGDTGKTSYFHVKYSNDGGASFTEGDGEIVGEYIGTYVDFIETDSSNPSDYTWYKIKGDEGGQGRPGDNGQTSYLHIKYSNDGGKTFTNPNGEKPGEVPGEYIGQYVDFTEADSSNPSDYKWYKIKGEQGSAGNSAEIIFEYALGTNSRFPPDHVFRPEIPSTNEQLGTPVIRLAEGDAVWSTTMPERSDGQYLWQRIKLIYTDGTIVFGKPACITGDKGSPGDGSYLHIKYSNDKGKTFTASNGETPGDYIGQYVDFIEADSSNPSDYKWYKIKGEQGGEGKPGDNGKTSYLHIKYSNDEGVTFTDNNGETVGDYIGQYVDFIEADSSNPSDYKWYKFRGDDGTSVTILGSYTTEEELLSAHPTGELGDAYLVAGDLYVWSGAAWENVGNIQGPQGESGQMLYASCSTDAETADKVATLASGSIELVSGTSVVVSFTKENNVSSPTLNVNDTGAKSIHLNGEEITSPAYYWVAGAVVTFVYDGTYWNIADASALTKANTAQDTADAAKKTADENADSIKGVNEALLSVDEIIQTIVKGPDGQTILTQDENGWTFSMSNYMQSYKDQMDATANKAGELEDSLATTNDAVNQLGKAVDDIGHKTSYVHISEDGIELGDSASMFKVRITNEDIQFMDGTTVPAYISNQKLMIETAEVKDELQLTAEDEDNKPIGMYIWKTRSNGNMGITWREAPILETPVIRLETT